MDRTRIVSLLLGLLTVLLMLVVGFLMSKPWFPTVTVGLPALGFLSFVLMTLRSWMKDPLPRPPSDKAVDSKDTTIPGVLLLIAVGSVLASTPFAVCSCAPSKQVVVPNPIVSDCISVKAQKEAQCNIDAKTAAEAETCKAKVREHRCSEREGGV